MRISDWSSDVCSSVLKLALFLVPASRPGVTATALPNIARAPLYRVDFDLPLAELARVGDGDGAAIFDETIARAAVLVAAQEIGRASCRERVCQTCRSRWSPYH